MCFCLFLTSGRGLILRGEDDETEALVVPALQGDVEALGPGRLGPLGGAGRLDAGRLGGGADQGGRHLVGLLAALFLSAAI